MLMGADADVAGIGGVLGAADAPEDVWLGADELCEPLDDVGEDCAGAGADCCGRGTIGEAAPL